MSESQCQETRLPICSCRHIHGHHSHNNHSDLNLEKSYAKIERLKSRKMISEIFQNDHVVKAYPVRIQYLFHEEEGYPDVQVGVSVSKRNFKRAVDRNRIKRQLRAACQSYHDLMIERARKSKRKLAMMIIYTDRVHPSYTHLMTKIGKCLAKL